MDSTFFTTLSSTMMLFVFIVSGYILRKTKSISNESSKVISSLLLNFFLPMLMISVITKYLTIENLMIGYPVLLISFSVILISYLIAIPISKLFTKDEAKQNILIFALVYSNFGFMGFPIIEAVYGTEKFLLLTLYTLPYYITVNVLGDYIIRTGKNKLNYKILLNPITVSIIIGFALVFLRIPISGFVSTWLGMITNCITPLSMLLAGIVLGAKPFKIMFTNPQIYMMSAIRLIVLPVLLMLILYLFGFRGANLGVPVLIMGMPVAVNGVMLAESLKGDSFTAAQSAFISTFLSLLTVPVLAHIILLIV